VSSAISAANVNNDADDSIGAGDAALVESGSHESRLEGAQADTELRFYQQLGTCAALRRQTTEQHWSWSTSRYSQYSAEIKLGKQADQQRRSGPSEGFCEY
jgi:hypothetical protein